MEAEIISVQVYPDRVEVVYRRKSCAVLCTCPPQPAPDEVWRETHKVENGVLVKQPAVQGKHTPAAFQPERIEFPAQPL